jgi:cell division protein FtsZ
MDEMGKAMMGTGEAEGEDRAVQAAEKAIANPLLDEISLKGARGVLINITGGHDLTLFELDEAANRIREEVDPEANIIVGSTLDESLGGHMRVSVVATGIDAVESHAETPLPRRSLAQPAQTKTIDAPAAAPVAAPVAAAPIAAQAPVAAPAPAPAPQQAAAPAPAPAAAPVVEQYEDEEPSLFQGLDAQRTAAEEQMETIFDDEPALGDDGLPPPAYQPQVAEFRPQPQSLEADPQDFVAPTPPAPGTPSPETMARLRAAATHQREATEAAAPAPQPEPKKAGFSVNSLIGRMTGNSAPAEQPQPAARRQPTVQAQRPAPMPQAEAEPEDDRIEIPAFLRRQAN